MNGGVLARIALFVCLFLCLAGVNGQDATPGGPLTSGEIVGDLIRYFSQDDPQGLPVLPIDDPLDYPDVLFVNDRMSLWGQKIFGFSHIRISSIVFNFTTFTVQAVFKLPVLTSLGNYSWKSSIWWDNDSEGATNITLGDVTVLLDASLSVGEEGALRLTEESTKLDLMYGILEVDFENLSTFYMSVIRIGLQSSISTILEWIKEWLIDAVNVELERTACFWTFPDSMRQIDFLLAQIRPQIRSLGLDPWHLGNAAAYVGLGMYVQYDDVVVTGLSSLHRTKDVYVKLVQDTIAVFVQAGTSNLDVTAAWRVPYLIGVRGRLHAQIDSFSVTLEVRQATNFKSSPVLRALDCRIGNVALTSSGMGSIDYLIEASVNVFPNVFRNEILDRLETKLWQSVQEVLHHIDLRTIILHHIEKKNKTTRIPE
ncbi:uncharacterized protein LOC134770124 [Penaeus indicus]|uniref:uncharacterized protein LOC134770124 n=1 Tax=Penaeus indicus TaxID=29960 RepID=UPI00300C4009